MEAKIGESWINVTELSEEDRIKTNNTLVQEMLNANPDKNWFFFAIEDELEIAGVKTRFMIPCQFTDVCGDGSKRTDNIRGGRFL